MDSPVVDFRFVALMQTGGRARTTDELQVSEPRFLPRKKMQRTTTSEGTIHKSSERTHGVMPLATTRKQAMPTMVINAQLHEAEQDPEQAAMLTSPYCLPHQKHVNAPKTPPA